VTSFETTPPAASATSALPGLSRRTFLGAAALATVGTGVLAACSSANSNKQVVQRHKDGILQIGIAGAPSNINPLDSGSEVTRWISEPVVETLWAYDDNLNSVPLLADGDPIISADQLTWTIKLKQGITWHNGDPLTADDVVATLEHISALSSGSEWVTYMLGYVQKFHADDKQTVEIGLARPYGLLRSHFTNMPIVHKDYVNRKNAMMGTGPFKLDSFVPGQSFTMSAYPAYHGTKPSFKGIQYTVFQDGSTRMVSLKQGKVDLITSVPYANLGSAKSDKNLRVSSVDAPLDILSYVHIGKEPFSDENFRRAIAAATDRAGVVSRVFGSQAEPGQGPIGPAELGYDASLQPYPAAPDYEKAKQYLMHAKTTQRSFTLTISTNDTVRNMAAVLAAGWQQIGVTVRIDQQQGGAWSNSLVGRNYDMIMDLFQSGFTSGPANYLALAPADPSNVLSCGYDNPEVEKLTATIWQTSDAAERKDALAQLNKILADDAVIFPPAYPRLIVAQRNEISPINEKLLRISRISPQTLSYQT
jgi:peptide/nickel transport system substrate-binding protein